MAQISVIVPIYKVEPYLRRCVDSILAQTFTDFELILVDDGSPDNCGAICDEYAQKDSRVHVIHQENGGLSAARNAGIDYCLSQKNSQYLSFIDSDDCVSPLYLEKLYLALVENHADVSICGDTSFSLNQTPVYTATNFSGNRVLDGKQACQLIYSYKSKHASYVSAWCKLYKTELFQNIRFPKGKLHEDQFTTYRVLYVAHRIVEIGDQLYGYFINENGIMHSRFNIKRFDDLVALDEAILFYQEHGEDGICLAAREWKGILWAQYSVQARKEGFYSRVPKQYKLSIRKADEILTREFGHDSSECYIYQYCPTYVKVTAYFRKLCAVKNQVKRVLGCARKN